MGGRSEARVFTSYWKDPDVKRLPMMARFTYLFLITQPELSHCGVMPLRIEAWAKRLDERSADELRSDIATLESEGFVVADYETQELLVRSLVRRDKVLRQPFLFPALAQAAGEVDSEYVRLVLARELVRCHAEGDVNARVASDLDGLIQSLSDCQPDTDPDCHPHRHSHRHPDRQSDTHPEREPGGGERNGSSTSGPPPPSPQAPAPAPRDDWRQGAMLTAVGASARAEGEAVRDQGTPTERGVTALVAEIRAVRRDWSETSIRKALTDERTLDRPWPLVRAAALIMAADLSSKHPGRLPNDGDWWDKARAQQVQESPPERRTCSGHRLPAVNAAGECRSCIADRKGKAS